MSLSQVQQADVVLFATPEYNFSVSGPLKNAIDWTSKGPNLWNKKLVSAVAAAGGSQGGKCRTAPTNDIHAACACCVLVMLFIPVACFSYLCAVCAARSALALNTIVTSLGAFYPPAGSKPVFVSACMGAYTS